MSVEESYVPFGDEWEKEIKKNSKDAIVRILRSACEINVEKTELINGLKQELKQYTVGMAGASDAWKAKVELSERLLRMIGDKP